MIEGNDYEVVAGNVMGTSSKLRNQQRLVEVMNEQTRSN